MEKVDFRCAKWNAQADVIALRQDVFTYHVYNFEKKKNCLYRSIFSQFGT